MSDEPLVPIDTDLDDLYKADRLTHADAAIYTISRHVIDLERAVGDLQKKMTAHQAAKPSPPVGSVSPDNWLC